MPTFTFTNNNRRFQAYLYWVTQSGVLEGGLALPSELTRTYVLDLPAGTEIRFTTHLEGWVDMSAPSGQGYFRDNGITFDTYRTTGAGHQTHTLRNISTQLSIRNRSASPIFLFKVDPHSGNDVAAGSLVPNEERQVSYDLQSPLKPIPSEIWRIKDAAGAVLKTYVTTAANRQEIEINAITLATMAKYTHVQFISWEIYTGPNRGPQPWAMGKDGIGYTGIGKENAPDNRLDVEGQIEDIRERLQFTYKAIEKAHELAVRHPSTLKVFMAPEFLYRGKGGAYRHDLINGWTKQPPGEFNLSGFDGFPGLFGYLKGLVAQNRFSDWLFVFGTAISASFPATFKTNGKWVVDSTKMGEIYNTALIQRGGEFTTDEAYASRKRYIASIDFIKSQYKAKGFTGGPGGDVVEADRLYLEPDESNREGSATFTINGINDKAGQPIMFGLEVCLDHSISTPRNPQPPLWANSTVYAIGKGVISPDNGWVYTCGIAHTSSASPTTFTQDNNNNPGRWLMPPLWANSTVYAIGNVVFSPDELYTCGIAHTSSASPTTFTQDNNNNPGRWVPYRNRWGRIRTADKWVKIQLIPSGGMDLKPASIRLLPAAGPTPHSYAFHCDGLATLWGDPSFQYQYGGHTQIWNGANGTDPVPRANQLINANYGQEVGTTSKRKVDDEIYEAAARTIKASDLWDLGSGYVRVMEEMEL